MSTPQVPAEKYLTTFPSWLASLGRDAGELAPLVDPGLPDDVRRYVTAGLNYVFKSLDLIPDGIDDIGFLDDAFVLRVAARLAAEGSPAPASASPILARLAEEGSAVETFLGEDYPRLVAYVKSLRRGAARGRTVDDIVGNDSVRATFTAEVAEWSRTYKVPNFSGDATTLEKLRAFLSAKLA